jgi:hypothetical protein
LRLSNSSKIRLVAKPLGSQEAAEEGRHQDELTRHSPRVKFIRFPFASSCSCHHNDSHFPSTTRHQRHPRVPNFRTPQPQRHLNNRLEYTSLDTNLRPLSTQCLDLTINTTSTINTRLKTRDIHLSSTLHSKATTSLGISSPRTLLSSSRKATMGSSSQAMISSTARPLMVGFSMDSK